MNCRARKFKSSSGVKPAFTWFCLTLEKISYSDKKNIWTVFQWFSKLTLPNTVRDPRLPRFGLFVTSLFYVIEPTQPTLIVYRWRINHKIFFNKVEQIWQGFKPKWLGNFHRHGHAKCKIWIFVFLKWYLKYFMAYVNFYLFLAYCI